MSSASLASFDHRFARARHSACEGAVPCHSEPPANDQHRLAVKVARAFPSESAWQPVPGTDRPDRHVPVYRVHPGER